MKSQTERRPTGQRPTQTSTQTRSTKTKKYTRQTAHVEARRDRTPLIFGWGSHLSRNEKTQIQRRAIWTLIALVPLIIIVIIAGFWIDYNIVIPNQSITSVNGQGISQSDYHKLVALKGELERNKVNGKNGLVTQSDTVRKQASDQQTIVDNQKKQIDSLNKQISALPTGSSTQRTDLENQLTIAQKKSNDAQAKFTTLSAQYQTLNSTTIPNEQVLNTQSQIGNESATWLQDDILIRNWLATQNSSIQTRINPSDNAISSAVSQLKAGFPTSVTYDAFLSSSNVSDGDIHTMMAVIVRRNNMQSYLASQINSPDRQVKARSMTLAGQSDATSMLKQLQSGKSFSDLAKQKSLDSATKASGGELGWLAQGEYLKQYGNDLNSVVDNWLSDPTRQVNQLSPALNENGTFHVLQIEAIDPSRAIDATRLKTLRNNAVNAWLLSQRALTNVKISSVDQTMLLDPSNVPTWIPTSAPTQATPAAGAPASGLPAGSTTGGSTTGGSATGGSTTGGSTTGGSATGQ